MSNFNLSAPVALIMTGCALVSCTDKAAEAERRFEMVERVGTLGEVCEAATAVADVYLGQQNEEEYRYWHALAGVKCQTAQFEGSDMPAQDDVREQIRAKVDADMEAMYGEAADAADGK